MSVMLICRWICEKICYQPYGICDICYSLLPHATAKPQQLIAFEYAGVVKKMLCCLKYSRELNYAATLAKLWCKRFTHTLHVDYILPVPTSKQRYQQRGFNQCLQLAKHISKQTGIPISCALHKSKHTIPQVGLTAKQRERNVTGSFSYEGPIARLAILDDTITTGATMLEITKVLQRSGCNVVEKWAIAHTVD